jgi:tetraacyldisaccharide 4'-kinase
MINLKNTPLKIFRDIVLSSMTGPEFRNSTPSLVVLYLFSKLYGLGVGLRSALYDTGVFRQKKLPCRVISIGNLSVGGTGKTPMTIYVARMLQDFGLRPVVISRGYRGALEKKGAIVSDRERVFSDAEAAGDEPLMMARALKGIPVMIGRNRFDVGMRAIRDFSADVIVLDDAFQHRQLHRDVELALIDDKTFFGNGHLLPRGILREPVSGLARSHACVLTRSLATPTGHFEKLCHMFPEKEIFRAFHMPYIHGMVQGKGQQPKHFYAPENPEDFSFLNRSHVFVFSGIAKNSEFREMVKEKVNTVAGCREYPDHHSYTLHDIEEILGQARQCATDTIITTEKDFSRLGHRAQGFNNLVVMGVTISFANDKERFHRFIRQHIL